MNNLCNQGNEMLKPSDPHSCCLCLKVFTNRQALRNHLEILHIRSQKFACNSCPKFYSGKQALKHHMKSHGKKSYECKICDYKTAAKFRFERHNLIHASKVDCPVCRKSVSNLKQHMYKHKPKVQCPVCSKMFQQYSLKAHIEIHLEKRIYVCEKCSEAFEDLEELRRY